jgi:demethylmenaquinone methyltransferase/2-methoxy-6-polyprenyl-1,4-benzoquinol methylase
MVEDAEPAHLVAAWDVYALGVARAQLDKQPSDVRRMFDTVARRYDLTNDLMTVGIQRSWRRAMVAAVDPRPGDLVLDLAAGTGCSTEPFGRYGATAVACDFSVGMLRQGRRDRPAVAFVAGDGTRLPFEDDTFDAVTISYGLRNFVDPLAGLREMHRVTRPGGRLVVCEFSTPVNGAFRAAYLDGFMRALPAIARLTASAPDAYVYLAESIRAWPAQEELAELVAAAGWQRPEWRNLTGGIVALHRATA